MGLEEIILTVGNYRDPGFGRFEFWHDGERSRPYAAVPCALNSYTDVIYFIRIVALCRANEEQKGASERE